MNIFVEENVFFKKRDQLNNFIFNYTNNLFMHMNICTVDEWKKKFYLFLFANFPEIEEPIRDNIQMTYVNDRKINDKYIEIYIWKEKKHDK